MGESRTPRWEARSCSIWRFEWVRALRRVRNEFAHRTVGDGEPRRKSSGCLFVHEHSQKITTGAGSLPVPIDDRITRHEQVDTVATRMRDLRALSPVGGLHKCLMFALKSPVLAIQPPVLRNNRKRPG